MEVVNFTGAYSGRSTKIDRATAKPSVMVCPSTRRLTANTMIQARRTAPTATGTHPSRFQPDAMIEGEPGVTRGFPAISPELKSMPQEIFYPEWGKLKQYIEAKKEKPAETKAAGA